MVGFAYESAYLDDAARVEIDPSLPLVAGRLHAEPDRMFGVFRYCAPDRWGRVLQALVAKLEHENADDDAELARWLSQLVAPGSSLGGARPKASFLAEDGSLWLAKFPARQDRYDQGAWEQLASVLAGRAGVDMPPSRLLQLGSHHRTFAANRDDHLRNHGFLRSPTGWTLSPAFAINPNPDKSEHALAIDEADPTSSVENLRSTRAL